MLNAEWQMTNTEEQIAESRVLVLKTWRSHLAFDIYYLVAGSQISEK